MMRSTDDDDSLGPVIRDRRRIDPVTGQVRDTGQPGAAGSDRAQSGSAQSGSAQSGSAQSGSAQPGPSRGRPQSKPGKHSASRPGGQAGTAQPGGARDASSRGPAGTGGSGGSAGGGASAGGGQDGRGGGAASGGQDGRGGGAASGGQDGRGGGAASGGQDGRGGGAASGGTATSGTAAAADLAAANARLAERTADLQRLQAEYANYRKRVERDRMAVREQALANVLGALLPILDDIGRAREHGELEGGFKSVAESLEAAAVKLGLTSYAEDGDPFDPNVHEALMHSYSDDVTEPTCVRILQPGYKVGDRILRPARVAVAEPGSPAQAADSGQEQPGARPAEDQDGSGPAGAAAPDPE